MQLAIFKILPALQCSALFGDFLTISCLYKWFLHVPQDSLRLPPPPLWMPPSTPPLPGGQWSQRKVGEGGYSWDQRLWNTIHRYFQRILFWGSWESIGCPSSEPSLPPHVKLLLIFHPSVAFSNSESELAVWPSLTNTTRQKWHCANLWA